MQYKDFVKRLSKISNLPLPGEHAQFEMAPFQRQNALKNMDIESQNPRLAGVMSLFYPNSDGEAYLVLILRRTYKGVHSNQVGFPGGKVEPDDVDLKATALRETQEEIGVNAHDITVIKAMSRLYIPPSNFWVHPFIGSVDYSPDFVPEDAEVAAVLEVSVADFLSAKNVTTVKISTSYASDIDVPAYTFNGYTVWGATAMMLSEIKAVIEQVSVDV